MRYAIFFAIAGILLSGCAAVPDAKTEQLKQEYMSTIPVCISDKDCELKWSAARRWVLSNAGYKIQSITSDYIETFNPPEASSLLGARIIKEPKGDGSYRITAELWCSNWIGCHPPVWEAAVDFNRTVNAARLN
ncbi:hypothetical protein IM720_08800 [Pseudomonas fluorescens]|uniref:Lipoprotein n=1 Tax=Pseudomonas fluorescens TaxID=294 RepID=A0A7M2JAZ1_PSEFL|nr:hypothetical protein [Pseudomonas fluorescens]QOU06805.1 hypothetical protein IM720_08800 [Pseudomonas fluorescens]